VSISIKAPEGAPFARILSTGSFRPARVVTNEEICENIDSSDEWIRERSGIAERRWAGDDETVAEKALAAAGITPDQIDVILIATCTHPYQTPSAASEVAGMIGAATAAAMDLSAACAGFAYGLALAQDMVRGGSAQHVLLIGAEKLSAWTDKFDRGTAFIFADGAGAVVVGPSNEPAISPVVWGGDGNQLHAINMTQNLLEFRDNHYDKFPAIAMNGQQVFRWAVSEMARVCRESLDKAGISAEDLDAFIPHQANNRITDAQVPHGGTALLVGFGAGLVFASQVVTLP